MNINFFLFKHIFPENIHGVSDIFCNVVLRSWERARWKHDVPKFGKLLVMKLGKYQQNMPKKQRQKSSTAQGGGGSFKNRKPIGEVGCCESRMAESTDGPKGGWGLLSFSLFLWERVRCKHDVLKCGKLLIMRLGKYQKTVPKNQRHKGTNQSTAQSKRWQNLKQSGWK